MPKVICAVIGCTNNTYRLNKWKNEVCEGHNKKKEECQCNRPFELYCFPSTLRNNEQGKDLLNIGILLTKLEKLKFYEINDHREMSSSWF